MDIFLCPQAPSHLLQAIQHPFNSWQQVINHFFLNILNGSFSILIHFPENLCISQFFYQVSHPIIWQKLLGAPHKIQDVIAHLNVCWVSFLENFHVDTVVTIELFPVFSQKIQFLRDVG